MLAQEVIACFFFTSVILFDEEASKETRLQFQERISQSIGLPMKSSFAELTRRRAREHGILRVPFTLEHISVWLVEFITGIISFMVISQ